MKRLDASVLVILVSLLASLATAALAHGVIELAASAGVGESAYTQYVHVAFAPLVLAVAVLLTAVVLIATLKVVASRGKRDAATVVLRRLQRASTTRSLAIVAGGGLVTLLMTEFLEQALSLGHVGGVVMALGGNAVVGLAIVVLCALVVTIPGLTALRALVTTTARAVGAVVAWIGAVLAASYSTSAGLRREEPRHDAADAGYLVRARGLRAPPRLA